MPTDDPREGRPASEPPCRYRPLRLLAEGGLGLVYLAHDAELGRDVALKEIRPELAGRPEAQARFVFEAQVTSSLEHPGIVPVHGLGRHPDGRPYYAMRFVRGGSLADLVEAHHAAPEPAGLRRLLRRFVAVCDAVAYAHGRGVVHRDLGPGNVRIGEFGEALVVGWGLARLMPPGGEGVSAAEKCVAESMPALAEPSGPAPPDVGTPGYVSPEQAADREGVGPRGDVYSLGVMLRHVLSGRTPFAGKVRAGRAANPPVPAALAAVCVKATASRPEGRYESASALAEEVERWLADEPVRAYAEPLASRVARGVRRRSALASGLLAALAVGVLALAAARQGRQDVEKERDRAVAAEREARAGLGRALADALDAGAEAEAQRASAEAAALRLMATCARLIEGDPARVADLLRAGEFAREQAEARRAHDPDAPHALAQMAHVWIYFARVQTYAGVPAASVGSYSRALALLERVRPDDLEEGVRPTHRDLMRRAYAARAAARRHRDEHAEAADDWGRVAELEASDRERLGYRTLRAESLARAGRHGDAMAEVAASSKGDGLSPAALYRLGRVCALCAAAARGEAERECCEAAMALFVRSFAGGHLAGERRKRLSAEPDLATLARREDFRKWLASLGEE